MQFASTVLAITVSALVIFAAVFVSAQESAVTYPVAELGSCKSKTDCRKYCDNLSHVNECVSFAEAKGLMSQEEATQARAFAKIGGKGPGGCTSKGQCESYCENVKNIKECLAFAEKNDILPQEDIEEARQIARALEGGAELPGGCTSKKECESFCESPQNMRQCLTFAKKAGFMDEKELAEAEKVAAFLDAGGQMPGGCSGERQCRTYCESGENMEECADFAMKAGFMTEKETEMFRKTGGRGPGGCRGRECEKFCEDETHQEECVAFALDNDLMSPEDKARMEEGKRESSRVLESAPPEVLSCVEAAIGAEKFEKLKRGESVIGRQLGEIIPRCFRDVMGSKRTGAFGGGTPPSAASCMRQVFGENFEERMQNGEVDPGARDAEIRECMKGELGEGYLRDDGQWERPQEGGPRGSGLREGVQDGNRGPSEEMRTEADARMRAEIEAQMRSGNFDASRLPPDFRPEGAFPPPESFNRPPEGAQMSPPEGSSGAPQVEYVPPPSGSESYPTPVPVTESAPTPTETRSEPVSVRNPFLANVLSIVSAIFRIQ